MEPSSGRVFEILPEVGPEYLLQFEFRLNSFESLGGDYTNVLLVISPNHKILSQILIFKGQVSSAGSYCCSLGTRVPAVFVKVDDKRIHFEVPMNSGTWAAWAYGNNARQGYNVYLQMGKWHRVEVRQYLIDSEVK